MSLSVWGTKGYSYTLVRSILFIGDIFTAKQKQQNKLKGFVNLFFFKRENVVFAKKVLGPNLVFV